MDWKKIKIEINGSKYSLKPIKADSLDAGALKKKIEKLKTLKKDKAEEFALILKSILSQLKYKQKDLASSMHLTKKTFYVQISNWMRGKNFPSQSNKALLVTVLESKIEEKKIK